MKRGDRRTERRCQWLDQSSSCRRRAESVSIASCLIYSAAVAALAAKGTAPDPFGVVILGPSDAVCARPGHGAVWPGFPNGASGLPVCREMNMHAHTHTSYCTRHGKCRCQCTRAARQHMAMHMAACTALRAATSLLAPPLVQCTRRSV